MAGRWRPTKVRAGPARARCYTDRNPDCNPDCNKQYPMFAINIVAAALLWKQLITVAVPRAPQLEALSPAPEHNLKTECVMRGCYFLHGGYGNTSSYRLLR